ncbi:MAG: DUF1320 domain-containing protein [Tannerella sp.]|jgi:phage gp36-like protein|nr:DUF1320 domain-containing protein [Tannerella sp.]
MFLTAEELKTHLYGESLQAIGGDDGTILAAAIDGAVAEARGYLAAYDRDTIFGAKDAGRNALLLIFVKDIAVWHYINLSNAGTELRLRQDRYERAVAWLRAVQKGEVTPDLPVAVDEDGTNPKATVIFGSNPKREQHF